MRNGDKVWYCKRISEDGDRLQKFAKPEEYTLRLHSLTIQPINEYDKNYSAVVRSGEKVVQMWNGIGQPYHKWQDLKEGDRFYVDYCTPHIPEDGSEPEDGWGYDANARIRSARLQNLAVNFILEKIE